MKQSSLDKYFKCKSGPASSSVSDTMNATNPSKKRRSLSLVKSKTTPNKTNKNNSGASSQTQVVNLCSDEELENSCPHINLSLSQQTNTSISDSSESTIIYNLSTSTPTKSSASKSYQSPKSDKFYSPTKNRAVFKKTPVKRKLSLDNFGNSPTYRREIVAENEEFTQACEGMDDKTILLLTIINKCLKEDNVKALLEDQSQEILSSCFGITKPGMRLICRLFWRKHGWYREEQLLHIINDKRHTIEQSTFTNILQCLIEHGLIKASARFGTNTMDFDELISVLKSEEVKEICKGFKLKTQTKRNGVDLLKSYCQQKSISNYFSSSPMNSNSSERVLKVMRSKVGTCYRLSDQAINTFTKLYYLMYLGINYEAMRDKKLEQILINDKIKRETYPIDKCMEVDSASVVFKSREEFARYWHAHLIYEDFLTRTKSAEKCDIVKKVYKLYNQIEEVDMNRYKSLPTWLRRFTPPHLYIKILEAGIQDLKKQGDHELAVEILDKLICQIAFRQRKKAEWYAEKALILYKLMARHNEAAEVLIEGLKSDLSEELKDAMRPRAHKLASRLNVDLRPPLRRQLLDLATQHLILENTFDADHVRKQHMETTNQRGKKKFAVHTEDGKKYLDAEDFCVLDYTKSGDYTHGEHWEGRIITTVFHLLFWDIIYEKPRGVVGIFLSHYQLHPLDLYDECFYVNRKTLIDDRLRSIEYMSVDELVETVKLKWEERPEYELSGINRSISWDSIRTVCEFLGSRAAAALCRRLAHNYGYAHSGFPDLTLWNIHTKKIKFVEVKTDTDKPSIKQLQWMQYLRRNNIETGFCYVGVLSTRNRARAPPSVPDERNFSIIDNLVEIDNNKDSLIVSKEVTTPSRTKTPQINNQRTSTNNKSTSATNNKKQLPKINKRASRNNELTSPTNKVTSPANKKTSTNNKITSSSNKRTSPTNNNLASSLTTSLVSDVESNECPQETDTTLTINQSSNLTRNSKKGTIVVKTITEINNDDDFQCIY